MSSEREQFQQRVDALVEQVRAWAESHEWVTKEYPKKLRDAEQHVYEVPSLFLQKGPTRVLLDPVAYDVPGADGVVDLYLMPTYDDMASLYLENGQWTMHYDFGAETPSADDTEARPLSEQSLIQVLDSIAAHAAPSF